MKDIDNKIVYDVFPQNNRLPVIVEAKIVYSQEKDCSQSDGDDFQHLTIEIKNGGIEKEDVYFVLSTERWAIDNPEEILNCINDFKSRIL